MNYWKSSFTVGPYSFGRFIGSPLDGVTNVPFRRVVRSLSPQALLYTEICHSNTIVNTDAYVWGVERNEWPINFQLCAPDTTYIEAACQRILEFGIKMVDINIGCPAQSVISTGAGSALMGDIDQLKDIIQILRPQLPIPLTVKMRAGFKASTALEIASMLEDLGVDAICIHPRLQSQKFSGELDYKLVANIKQKVKIPVLFSGGITQWSIAKAVYEMTGTDGFLIGRALTGTPWLLDQLTHESQGEHYPITRELIISSMLSHFEHAISWFAPRRGAAYFKKHLKIYLAHLGIVGKDSIKFLANDDVDELKNALENL